MQQFLLERLREITEEEEQILRGSMAWPWCFGVAGMSAGFFLLARAVFYRGIRHYESVGM